MRERSVYSIYSILYIYMDERGGENVNFLVRSFVRTNETRMHYTWIAGDINFLAWTCSGKRPTPMYIEYIGVAKRE